MQAAVLGQNRGCASPAGLQGGVSGELLIGGSSTPGQYVLPPLLGHFKRQCPDITVCLSITAHGILERIIRRHLKLGIVGACVQHTQVLYDRCRG